MDSALFNKLRHRVESSMADIDEQLESINGALCALVKDDAPSYEVKLKLASIGDAVSLITMATRELKASVLWCNQRVGGKKNG